jgi:hypothetical protein
VPHLRLGPDISLDSFLCLAIRERQPFVLAEMLGPGGDNEGFDVPIRILHVAENAPAPRAVATPNPSMLTNRCEELRGFFCSNLIFDSDKDGPKVVVCREGLILGGGQSPVIPGG